MKAQVLLVEQYYEEHIILMQLSDLISVGSHICHRRDCSIYFIFYSKSGGHNTYINPL